MKARYYTLGLIGLTITLVTPSPSTAQTRALSASLHSLSYDGPAELPRSVPFAGTPTVTGSTFKVKVGDPRSLQSQIYAAAAADGNLTHEVVVPVGIYVGRFNLPKKLGANPSGAGYIIIRSAGTLPAEGTRVTPRDASQLATLTMTARSSADRVLSTSPGAHHYYIVGLKLTLNTGSVDVSGLVNFGASAGDQAGVMPHHMILARCWVYGSTTVKVRRGLSLESAESAVVDSYFEQFNSEADTQAINTINGAGPFKISNNFLSSTGENFMSGGGDPGTRGQNPADITFSLNHLWKDPAWKGSGYAVKNLFELKNANRVLIEANVFENNWSSDSDQRGQAFNIKTAVQGSAAWGETRDITVRYNIVRNCLIFATITSRTPSNLGVPASNISIHDNLVYNVGSFNGDSDGRMFVIGSGPLKSDALGPLSITNNTLVPNYTGGVSALMVLDGSAQGVGASGPLNFEGNIAYLAIAGVKAPGILAGTTSLRYFFLSSTFIGNLIVGQASIALPPGNTFVADTTEVRFADPAKHDYSLAADSPALTASSGAKRAGADIPTVLSKTTGVVKPLI